MHVPAKNACNNACCNCKDIIVAEFGPGKLVVNIISCCLPPLSVVIVEAVALCSWSVCILHWVCELARGRGGLLALLKCNRAYHFLQVILFTLSQSCAWSMILQQQHWKPILVSRLSHNSTPLGFFFPSSLKAKFLRGKLAEWHTDE